MENKTPRYIDTNELIRLYNLWITQLQDPEDEGALEGVQTCLDVLLEQPVVDAVPVVHGRWIANRICSICRKELTEWAAQNGYRYCPNCGAKMDGGNDYGK